MAVNEWSVCLHGSNALKVWTGKSQVGEKQLPSCHEQTIGYNNRKLSDVLDWKTKLDDCTTI